jgi:hypothetical protein
MLKNVEEKINESIEKLILHNTETNIRNNTEEMDISKMNRMELLRKCKELGIVKCNSKNKAQLIELVNSKQTNVAETRVAEVRTVSLFYL